MNNDFKFPSSRQDWSSQNISHLDTNKVEKETNQSLETAADQTKPSQSLSEKAVIIQDIYADVFKEVTHQSEANVKDLTQNISKQETEKAGLNQKAENKAILAENKAILADNLKNAYVARTQYLKIGDKDLHKAILEHTQGRNLSPAEVRKFLVDLRQSGGLQVIGEDGQLRNLTDEELEDVINLTVDFLQNYAMVMNFEETPEERDIEDDQQRPIDHHPALEEAGRTHSARATVVNPQKDKKLKLILAMFIMHKAAVEEAHVREKKEKQRELADLANREAIKLKELKLERMHEDINVENIDREQLQHEEIKQSLNKMDTILTPLQTFSRSVGGIKLVQMEGEGSLPLKNHIVKEFNLEPNYKKRILEHEVSLLKISQNPKYNGSAVAA